MLYPYPDYFDVLVFESCEFKKLVYSICAFSFQKLTTQEVSEYVTKCMINVFVVEESKGAPLNVWQSKFEISVC